MNANCRKIWTITKSKSTRVQPSRIVIFWSPSVTEIFMHQQTLLSLLRTLSPSPMKPGAVLQKWSFRSVVHRISTHFFLSLSCNFFCGLLFAWLISGYSETAAIWNRCTQLLKCPMQIVTKHGFRPSRKKKTLATHSGFQIFSTDPFSLSLFAANFASSKARFQ